MIGLAALAPLAALAVPLVAKVAEVGVKLATDVAGKALEFAKDTGNQNSQIKF
ncbi:hypothetical protein ACW9H6_19360 [Pseudomonas sp. SDO528_S397]